MTTPSARRSTAPDDVGDREWLATELYRVSHLTGEFLLRSGATATEYFDKYQFESRPALLRQIATAMVPLIPTGTEVLAGLELGGVPIAIAMSLQTELPVALVRKKAKTYGTCRVAEGPDLAGRRVTVIEDVVTSGGQIVLSTQDLREAGATVEDALCVIDREAGGRAALKEVGVHLTPLYQADDLRTASS
ncbi:MAG: orotate phosphoribosyltransferase [Propionibacteriales bacterium]|nr:orotate phosphoribosyltransferase [Propionibacteriales bacterium]